MIEYSQQALECPERQSMSRIGARARVAIACAVVIYLVVVTATRAPLIWDGSYYLLRILDDGRPFVVYGRFTVLPLHYPTLWIGHLTGSVDPASYVFSFSYALPPLIALALGWYWHRSDIRAFLWSVIGIFASVLPSQVFFVSEATLAVQLWCPMFILAVTGRWRSHRVSLLVVGVAVLGLHPIAVVLLCLLAVAIVLRPQVTRTGVVLAGALATAVFLRAVTLAGYETSGLPSLTRAVSRGGYVNSSAFFLLALAVLLTASSAVWPTYSRRLQWMAYAAAATSVPLHLLAALDPWFLSQASGARFALPLSAVAIAAIAAVDLTRRRSSSLRTLALVATAGVGTYLVHTLAAAVTWRQLVVTLVEPRLAPTSVRCLDIDGEPSFRGTPLATWSTSALSIVLQGRHPSHIFLRYGGCIEPSAGRPLLLLDAAHGGPRARDAGWFDLTDAGLTEPPSR